MQVQKTQPRSGPRQIRHACTDGFTRQLSPPPEALSGTWVSRHALARLREHHPNIGVRGALELLARSSECEPGLVAPILGRPLEKVRDRYFFSADRRGVFVIAPSLPGSSFAWAMVTYLRVGPYQQEVATRLLGAA